MAWHEAKVSRVKCSRLNSANEPSASPADLSIKYPTGGLLVQISFQELRRNVAHAAVHRRKPQYPVGDLQGASMSSNAARARTVTWLWPIMLLLGLVVAPLAWMVLALMTAVATC